MACAVWGKQWKNSTVLFRCDNMAVVAIVNSGRSRDQLAMHLMRCLSFFLAHFNLFTVAEHIQGRLNVAADSLSRNNLSRFRSQVRSANISPVMVPEELREALISQRPDWTSPLWRDLFTSTLQKV